MAGHFDEEEWSFECKRDERAAKEIEQIKAIRAKWKNWVKYRKVHFKQSYNDELQAFADAEAEKEIANLRKDGTN